MNKKRIFIANDASFLNTGYGVYGKEIISRIHKSDKYEVAELGCYADIKNPNIKSIPWKFYPNGVKNDDPRFQQFASNNLNQFGQWRFNRCVADFKPHIVFDVRDYWMYYYQDTSPYRPYFSWVIMPTTDSYPPKIEWLYTYQNAELIVPYTDFAKKVLQETCGNRINLFPKIANAGINPDEFYPIEDKTEHKIRLLGQDLNIVGVVMRNQKRKLIAELFLAFKSFLEQLKASKYDELYKKTFLYLHTSYPEENGWDIPSLLLEYGLLDKVYFTYKCRNCLKVSYAKFDPSLKVCNNCNHRSVSISGTNNSVTTPELNHIYNLFDIFIQYAICEGFGMPQVEAAACGLQIASVDYSAMTEIAEKLNGIKIPVQKLFREMEINADRAYPDNDFTAKMLYDFFVNTSKESKTQNSKIIREKTLSTYTWDSVYKVWEEAFDSIDISKKVSWDSKSVSQVQNMSVKVPNNLDAKEFVEFICLNVINDPNLLRTSNIQILIKDMVNGLTARSGFTSQITKQEALTMLEGFLNNKIVCEKIKNNPNSFTREDFLL